MFYRMSERNQGDTFSDFETMTDRLVGEILYHIETFGLVRFKILISFMIKLCDDFNKIYYLFSTFRIHRKFHLSHIHLEL
jgi:hypothetical protein